MVNLLLNSIDARLWNQKPKYYSKLSCRDMPKLNYVDSF